VAPTGRVSGGPIEDQPTEEPLTMTAIHYDLPSSGAAPLDSFEQTPAEALA